MASTQDMTKIVLIAPARQKAGSSKRIAVSSLRDQLRTAAILPQLFTRLKFAVGNSWSADVL
jgi:hypothetical protein